MTELPSGDTLTALSEKHSSWSEELVQHSQRCELCWSISDESHAHRLARLE